MERRRNALQQLCLGREIKMQTYTEGYIKHADKRQFVTIDNLTASICFYLESICKQYNSMISPINGVEATDFNVIDNGNNTYNFVLGSDDPTKVDEFIKIADALMIYRYGHRVQVNGWPIGEEGR